MATDFATLAPQVIQALSTDLGISPEQAAGVVGQLGFESDGLQAINERQPMVPGSRGGFGWSQWTGPRREAFETWAGQNQLDPGSPEANYGFLLHELTNTPESKVVEALKAAPDAQTAGRIFTEQFLRPGIPAQDQRASWTDKAMNFLVPEARAGGLDDLDKEFFGSGGQQAAPEGGSDLDALDQEFFSQPQGGQPAAPVTQVYSDGKGDSVRVPTEASPLKEAAKVVGKSVYGGLTAIPRMVMAGGDALESAFPTPSWTKIPLPPGAEAADMLDQRILKAVQPETELGKAAANVGEATVGAVAGPAGGLTALTRAGLGAASGLGSEIAARFLGDTPLVRIGGGLVGGGLGSMATTTSNAKGLMQRAVRGVPEEDWRKAEAMKSTLEKEGVPHLNSQLLGPSSTLADLGERVASHPTIRPGLNAKLSKTSEAMVDSYENWKNTNLPPSVTSTQSVLSDVQGAAAGKIAGLRQAATRGYGDLIPDEAADMPLTREALEEGVEGFRQLRFQEGPTTSAGKAAQREITKLSSMIERLDSEDYREIPKLRELNNILKDLNAKTQEAGYSGYVKNVIKQAYRDMTPEYEDAREAMKTAIDETVNPAKKGLLGQIAGLGGGVKPDRVTATERMLDLVFPSGRAQPQEIKELGKYLGPDAMAEITREYLSRAMNKAATESLSGTLQKPFAFRAAVYGSPAQKQNLEAALEVASRAAGANPAAVKDGFRKILDAFESFADLKIPGGIDSTTLEQQAGKNVISPFIALMSRLARSTDQHFTEKTYTKIAEVLTSPTGLKQLEIYAKQPTINRLKPIMSAILVESQTTDDPETRNALVPGASGE